MRKNYVLVKARFLPFIFKNNRKIWEKQLFLGLKYLIIIINLKNTIISSGFFSTHGKELDGIICISQNCSSFIKKRHQILQVPYFLLLKKEQQQLVISVFITVSSWIQELWDGLFGCSALFIWKPRTNHSSRQEQIIESNNVLLDIHHALALLLVPYTLTLVGPSSIF